jgi:hypothetical protein
VKKGSIPDRNRLLMGHPTVNMAQIHRKFESKNVTKNVAVITNLKPMFKKVGARLYTGLNWLRKKTSFFNLHSGGWSPNWVHSARRPLTGLLYLPRVIVMMENLVE